MQTTSAASDGSTRWPERLLHLRFRGARNVGWYLIAAAVALIVITPIARFYGLAFGDGAAAIRRLPDIPNFGTTLVNTVALAAGSTTFAVCFALMLAKATLHVPRRLRGVASFLPIVPLAIPAVANVIGWAFLFSPSVGYVNWTMRQLPLFSNLTEGPFNAYSMTSIIIVTGFNLTGIVYTFVYARLREVSGSLESAARLSGASPMRAFFTVTVPLLRPSIVASVVIVFLLGIGQFTAPLLLGSRRGISVLTTEIFRLREGFPIDYAATAALALPLLVVGLLSIVFQRLVVGDQRRYVTTQSRGGSTATTKTSKAATALVLMYAAISVVLPLVAIFLVAVSPFWSGDLSQFSLTMGNFGETLTDSQVYESIRTSATTAVLASLIALPLGFVGALAMTGPFRAPRVPQYALDASFLAPLAVPRAALGLVVLYVFLQPPFSLYGSYLLFILGYVFVVMPFALRTQHASLISIGNSLFEAARICGASQLRTILGIALPLARRGIAAAATIMVVLLTHDFAVSVMVRSPGNHVMGTLLYDFWETGGYPEVAVMALVMTVVTALGLVATYAIGGKSALEQL